MTQMNGRDGDEIRDENEKVVGRHLGVRLGNNLWLIGCEM